MFQALYKSFYDMNFYKKAAQNSGWKAVWFSLLVSLIAAIIMALFIFAAQRQPAYDAVEKLASYTPHMQLSGGKLTVNNDQQLVIAPEELQGYKVVFDTGRTEPVYPTQLRNDNIILMATGNTLYTISPDSDQMQATPYDEELNYTIEAQNIRDNKDLIVNVGLSLIAGFVFMGQFIKLPFIILLAAIAVWLINNVMRVGLGGAGIFKVACYLQAPAALLSVINFVLPIKIPFITIVSLAMFALYANFILKNIGTANDTEA